MKVVILAGGKGTRMEEETRVIPKPMVEIGGRPILWHIMKHYSHYGISEFIIALGHKGEHIKSYFSASPISGHIDLVDTGSETNTGGRLRRLADWLAGSRFMLTYGDGVSTIDLNALLSLHDRLGCMATLSAVQPPPRFGALVCDGALVKSFAEKGDRQWINGGFMVLEPDVLQTIAGDGASLEFDVLPALVARHQVAAYHHSGFWHCMDTLNDKRMLQNLWSSGSPPWKLWTD